MFLTTNSLLFNALVDVNNCENGIGERRTIGFLVKLVKKGLVFAIKESSWMPPERTKKRKKSSKISHAVFLTTTSLLFNTLVAVNNCENSRSNGGTHVFLVKLIEKASFFTIKESSWMGLEMAKKR